MKKLIALLLALLMVSSAVIAVSAEGTGEVVPTAPTIFAQTEPVIDKGEDEESAEDDTIVGYNVRFLAAVHETTGEAIGFEVVAKYSGKEDAYSKAEGDTAMEGTMLYKNVMVEGESKPVTNYDADAIGMFAAGINGVPTNLDIVFEIKAYITYGESEKVETGVVTAQYANGKILSMTGADVYTQDFNATSSVAAAVNAGVNNLYGGTMDPMIDNGRLRIPDVGWSHAFAELVGKKYFSENVNNLGTYAIEMDLDIAKKTVLGLYINGSVDDSMNSTNTRNTRTGATFIQFVYDDDDNNKGKTIKEMAGKSLYARFAYVNGSKASSYSSWSKLYTIPTSFTGASETAKFKLSIVVDSSSATGCDIHLFIDDTYKATYTLTDTDTLKFDVHENSYVSLLAQNSPLTLDNLRVCSVALTKSENTITGYTETTTATPYSQNFDNDPVASVGVTRPYANDNCPSGLPLTINDAGQLQVNKHSWHKYPDYFAHLVSSDEVQEAAIYKFEADVSISAASVFAFTFNNDEYETATDNTKYLSQMLMVKTEVANGQVTKLLVDEYKKDGSGRTGTAATSYELATPVSAADFKFSVIVDSSDASKCTLYLFINDTLVGVHTATNTDSLNYNVKDVSTIGIWAQDTVATIDNIKVSGVKKNS